MNKLILFCLETNKQSDTDRPYIMETIKRYYKDDRKTVIRTVYLRSKTRYKENSVVKEITRCKNEFPNNNVTVIYCIDVDDYDTSPDTKTLLDNIKAYCKTNHYEFVFFCRDIEDVYWKRRATKNEKVPMATAFRVKHQIDVVKESQLRKTNYAKNSSNILIVLDNHFIKK